MALPAPDLDDRRFQDFVDDAKRLVQRRCPEWTDHNVSDPGVTLIEAVASMADQIVYRLNRVPDRLHLRFLDLVGVRLHPPAAAVVPVTFWLSAPQDETVTIPQGTEVATRRTPNDAPIGFTTTRTLEVRPVRLVELRSAHTDGTVHEHREDRAAGHRVRCFADPPAVGDALLLGLDEAAPAAAVALRLDCRIDGIGVDPQHPPLRYEAWTGQDWSPCTVDRDTTGGLNQPGEVVLHLPPGHAPSLIGGLRAGWLRAVVVAPLADRTAYSSSPTVSCVEAVAIGGTVDAVHAETVPGEVIGTSEGVPAQRFTVRRAPVLTGARRVRLEVADGAQADAGWQVWEPVANFGGSDDADRHFVIDAASGEIALGPCVRLPDGTVRQHGAVPESGAVLRVGPYLTGGGVAGNVAVGAITVLRSSIPYVARVENRSPARGGRDGESLDNARSRGALVVRSRGRAVTCEDFEHVAREAAPGLARVRCVPAGDDASAGAVRLLAVPALGDVGRVPFDALRPSDDDLARVSAALDERRLVGTRAVVEPPRYQGVTAVARLRARPGAVDDEVRQEAVAALYRFLSPVVGGPDGQGWPFGRPVQYGEVFAVLQRIAGVDLIEDLRLFPADPVTGSREEAVTAVEVGVDGLVFSYDHQVRVTPS
jgi:predicted phage baseplate assembly protein